MAPSLCVTPRTVGAVLRTGTAAVGLLGEGSVVELAGAVFLGPKMRIAKKSAPLPRRPTSLLSPLPTMDGRASVEQAPLASPRFSAALEGPAPATMQYRGGGSGGGGPPPSRGGPPSGPLCLLLRCCWFAQTHPPAPTASSQPGGSEPGGGAPGHPRLVRPAPEEVVYNGKRMRKPVTRKGVDFNASMLNLEKRRKHVRDVRDAEFIQWDLDDAPPNPDEKALPGHPDGSKNLLPPSAMEMCFASSVTTRYTHTSINKVRYPVNALCFSPDGRRVISGASSGEFTLWNAQHFVRLPVGCQGCLLLLRLLAQNFETILQAHESAVRTMVYSHSDEYLITGDQNGIIKYWQPNFNNLKVGAVQGWLCRRATLTPSLAFAKVFTAHEQPVRQACFAPTDLKFATCSDDGFVKVWDFVRAETERSMEGHGWDVKVCMWSARPSTLRVFASRTPCSQTVDWHPSKGVIASGGKDSQLRGGPRL